jgi:hypothetical protein
MMKPPGFEPSAPSAQPSPEPPQEAKVEKILSPSEKLRELIDSGALKNFDNTRFDSELPGIDAVFALLPRTPKGGPPPKNDLTIGLIYDKAVAAKATRGGERFTATSNLGLYPDGMIGGELRDEVKRLGVTKEKVLDELVRHLEQLHADKWVGDEESPEAGPPLQTIFDNLADFQEILKAWYPGEGEGLKGLPFPRPEGPGKGERTWDPSRLKLDRLQFLDKLFKRPDVLFGVFKANKDWIKADQIIAYDGYILIENIMSNHAIYLVEMSDAMRDGLKDAPPRKDYKAFMAWLHAQPWYAWTDAFRQDLIKMGASRIIHDPRVDWQAETFAKLDELQAKKNKKGPSP